MGARPTEIMDSDWAGAASAPLRGVTTSQSQPAAVPAPLKGEPRLPPVNVAHSGVTLTPSRQLRKTLFSQALPRKETLFYRVFRSNVCGKVRFFEVPSRRELFGREGVSKASLIEGGGSAQPRRRESVLVKVLFRGGFRSPAGRCKPSARLRYRVRARAWRAPCPAARPPGRSC